MSTSVIVIMYSLSPKIEGGNLSLINRWSWKNIQFHSLCQSDTTVYTTLTSYTWYCCSCHQTSDRQRVLEWLLAFWREALTHECRYALWQHRCQAGLKCVHLASVSIFSCFVQCFQIMSRSLLGLYYLAGGWVLVVGYCVPLLA